MMDRLSRLRPIAVVTLFLGVAGMCGCTDGSPSDGGRTQRVPVPDKIVVLTFDDASRTHLEFVAPILRKHRFGATFFVTQHWMADARRFLSFEEVALLHKQGFEIGSHSYDHSGWHLPIARENLPMDFDQMNAALAKVGVPVPTSFSWPGSVFGPEGREVLAREGIRFARRGLHPEYAPGDLRGGTLYDPKLNDPLLIPSAGDSNPSWDFEHFVQVVSGAKDGRIAVLVFHGVPDLLNYDVSTTRDQFERYMRYLADERFSVIAMRDLDRYVDPDVHPDDPMIGRRVPE